MDKRPLAQNMRRSLVEEMEIWRVSNLITEEQKLAILDAYESPRQSESRQHSVAIFVLLGISALLVGLAVFLLIGYNWQAMPRPIKLILIVGTILGTYASAFYLRYWRNQRVFSEVVFFLGAMFFGVSIWLVAQVFHLNAHYPDGFWWWAVGVLLIALCLDTILLHLLVTAILAIWVGTEFLAFSHMRYHWYYLGVRPGCYSLPIFTSIGLIWAYYKKSPFTVALYVPLTVWWAMLLPHTSLHPGWNPLFFWGSLGGLLLLLAEIHKEGSTLARPYRLYGTLLCMGVLSCFSFYRFHAQFWYSISHTLFLLPTILVTLLAGAALIFAFVMPRRGGKLNSSINMPVYRFLVQQWLPISLLVLMFLMAIWYTWVTSQARDRYDDFGFFTTADYDLGTAKLSCLVFTIISNVAMLAFALWLMMVGLREERGIPFTASILYFLLWALQRYIDLFSGAGGMLGASFMFFITGGVIFGAALFWHRRKKLIERGTT